MAETTWAQKLLDRLWSTTLVRRWTCGLALWLGVWLWVAILVAAERSAAVEPGLLKLSLGWLPCAIASVLTSLYIQAGGNYVGIRRDGAIILMLAGVAFVWTLLQGYLGGVGNASLAAVILVAGELQSWLGRAPDTQRAPLSGGEEPSPGVEREVRDEAPQAESRTNPVGMEAAAVGALAAGADVVPAEDNGPGALIAAEREASREASGEGSSEASRKSVVEVDEEDEEADGECGGDEELEEETEQDGTTERRGDWLQQMTRSRQAGVETGVAEAESDSQIERLEWFGRHLWRATETQVSLHVLFQPAFGERPGVTAEVVEGAGKVSVAELQPHGARLLLKRPADTANRTEPTVVWLEAIGPVNQEE